MPNDRVIIAGIDEAGYGPLLGPLVVSCTTFEVPTRKAQVDLWDALRASVSERGRSGEARLVVADSKRVYCPGSGLDRLERAVLAFVRLSGPLPPDARNLLSRLTGGLPAGLAAHPWYDPAGLRLPIDCDPMEIATQTNALRADLRKQGMRFLRVCSQVLLEGEFNELVGKTDNKARLLWTLTARLIDRLIASAGRASKVRIWVDKQGARNLYAQPLMLAFPAARLRILVESPECSDYELCWPNRQVRVGFAARGEEGHLPVALASMVSKYVRELLMTSFNHYWTRRVSGLAPTAGYYKDGLRFLDQIGPALEGMGVERSRLVRDR
jgi:ribonuclease HII